MKEKKGGNEGNLGIKQSIKIVLITHNTKQFNFYFLNNIQMLFMTSKSKTLI